MRWEDWIITIRQIIFMFALVPTLTGKDKPAKTTSFITFVVLLAFCAAQYFLKLYFATVTTFILACLWFILGIQKLRIDKLE